MTNDHNPMLQAIIINPALGGTLLAQQEAGEEILQKTIETLEKEKGGKYPS